MDYRAEIREIPAHVIYYKEYFVENLNDFLKAIEGRNILQELSDKVMLENPEIQLTDPDYNVILYADGEFQERNIRIEFCDAVTAMGRDTEEYHFREVPAFTALNVMHKGSNKKLAAAYAFAFQWMRDNGYRKAGSPRNSTIDGFWNRDNEEDYLTEIQIPVEKI